MCVYVCLHGFIYTTCAQERQKKASESLELQVVLSHLIEMLEIKHRSSVTTVNAPNCRPISSVGIFTHISQDQSFSAQYC